MKAVYVGADIDIRRADQLFRLECTDLICIDSKPYNEFGIHKKNKGNNYTRPDFPKNLKKTLMRNKFTLICEEENRLYYEKKGRRLTYIMNTSVPENLDTIQDAIEGFDVLINVGHHCHKAILDYTNKPIIFVGCDSTGYRNVVDFPDSVLEKLYECQETRKRFASFVYFKWKVEHIYSDWWLFINATDN